jgi:hypothetical protein
MQPRWGFPTLAPSNRPVRAHRKIRRPGPSVASSEVKRLEEIVYEAGRDALADQEALVAGVRQRTGTLLAAHALVASFLGATTIREAGLEAWGWVASGCLVLGLIAAAVLLAPWRLKFAVDARQLYDELYAEAAAEAEADTLGWLARAGYSYQALRERTPPASGECRAAAAPWAFSWSSRRSAGSPAWR